MQYQMFVVGLILSLLGLVACVPVEKTQTDAKNAEYHYMLGVSSLNERNPTEALKEFLQAEKFDSQDPQIQSGLANAYWRKQAYGLAEKHFKRAIELSNEAPKYYNNLAALYLSTERYDEAISAFKRAAENLLFDRPGMAWTGIGIAYVQKQDYPAAQRAYEKAMDISPRFSLAPFRLGELYYNLDRPVEALEMFNRSVELAPGFVMGHYWRGLTLMKMKNPEMAKIDFLEVIRLAPAGETARLAENYLKIIDK